MDYKDLTKRREQNVAANRRRKYGLTREGFAWMLEQQGGACATCDSSAAQVDHDPADDNVRALLCGACNMAVQAIEKARRTAQRIHDYVGAHTLP